MRSLDYSKVYSGLLTPEVIAYMMQIHELKGKQTFFIKEYGNILARFRETARIQSIEAACQIEGIAAVYERLKKLALNKTTPRNQNEREIAGYRDALITIRENHNYIALNPSSVLQLHRELYKFNTSVAGGTFRISNALAPKESAIPVANRPAEQVPASETPKAVETLCHACTSILKETIIDPLLVIPMFILDFLRIQPFYTGNGYMSRLLALLLLYQSGYIIFDYVSLEKLIADNMESYYEALQENAAEQNDGRSDYMPFVQYWLRIVLNAFQQCFKQVETQIAGGLSKTDRVLNILRNTAGSITKAELMAQCPDISQKTIERALTDLLGTNRIIKIGGGRYTSYTWNREDNDP